MQVSASHIHFLKNTASQKGAGVFFRPKLSINAPNDIYEQEADATAEKVMRMPGEDVVQTKFIKPSVSPIQRKCADCEEEEKKMQRKEVNDDTSNSPAQTENYINSLSGGRPLNKSERSFFEPRFGYDFSRVRIHNDSKADESAKSINALAYTHGENIVFASNQYKPETESGKRLLAHELTHTIQQKEMTGEGAQRCIQRTTVGAILDEFFSPFSDETLWAMNESDNYTVIVRGWQPVIDALNLIKENIASDCATWSAAHRTTASFRPGMTEPMILDPNAYRHGVWIPSPPGTDPDTCRNAFVIYEGTKYSLGPTVQTRDLYTCSIGSFGLAVTVNSIDCASNTADINVWMYNIMSEHSFGKFARYFPASGMKNQYMWWNWDETIRWTGSGGVSTDPERRRGRW